MWLRIRDPESFGPWIRDGKIRIRDKHPGSATLLRSLAAALSSQFRSFLTWFYFRIAYEAVPNPYLRID
jgi:hypothetical protein